MKGNLLKKIAQFLKEHRFNKRWQKLVTVLAVIVVFCTTYMLILPAITMEGNVICGMQEHTHGAECYAEVATETALKCVLSRHEHTDGCYNTDNEIVCGYADFVLHTHAENCYDGDNIACNLEEKQEYEHTEECLDSEGNLICEKEEIKLHTHTEECLDENGDEILACGLLEITEHNHTEDCFEVLATETTVVCEISEHIHFEDCYDKEDITVYTTENTETTTQTATEDNSEITTSSENETTNGKEEGTSTEETTEKTTEETTTSVSDETENSENETGEHIHTDDCYTSDEMLACIEWGKAEPWSLDWASDEFKDSAVKYVTYLINQLPVTTEFEEKLEAYDTAEDYEAYEDYYRSIYKLVSKAFVNFENLGPELGENVPNKEHLMEYQWIYRGNSTYAITESRTVEFVNYYDNATSYKSVLIHSNSVGDISSFGFYWWYAVVVDENEYGDLIVTGKYDYSLTNKSNLKPSTARGFVLLSHGDSNTFDCSVGDEATVSFDYLNTTAGYNSGSYGTVTFSEYTIPVDVEEDYVLVPDEPSDSQVIDGGGTVTAADKDVVVSKKIDGTDLENVFDITLTVQTKTEVQTFLSEPDMAVVIVMDISNTMNSYYPTGQTETTRYDAAIASAEDFINKFKENTSGISQIGFVAFNTSAHEIFALQPCSTDTEATALISEMKTDTNSIISASGYADAHTRFTNVEAGLKRGYDMLASSGNANQYIIFLSDGFPTTYLKSGTTTYEGYDPYTPSGTPGTDGVFYDYVQGKYCSYGTSYSDKASVRAREMATTIKDSGAKIFSIGVDVAGQTIQRYSDATSGSGYYHSIVDRTSTTYEIGDASSTAAYQNWLKNSIGSGYYYDSNNSEELSTAFDMIFEEIRQLNSQNTMTIWTATDPLPVLDENAKTVEFIYFYDKDGNAASNSLTGTFTEGGEDTANCENDIIYWDLKKSGYTTSVEDNVTYYFYSVTYRVRLQNEQTAFVENQEYSTNGNAFLTYRTIVTTNGVQEISETKTVYFPKPSVKGYLAELNFLKQNYQGESLENATFTLTHDVEKCAVCRGDETAVTTVGVVQEDGSVLPYTATSDSGGKVAFTNIPSGHTYYLTETVPPIGYVVTKSTFSVVVAYDKITVTETLPDGTQKTWTGDGTDVVSNYTGYVLPATGGTGVTYYYIFGGAFVALSLFVLFRQTKRKKANATP